MFMGSLVSPCRRWSLRNKLSLSTPHNMSQQGHKSQQQQGGTSNILGELIEKARHHNIFAVVCHQVGRYLHKHSFCVVIESITNRTQFFRHYPPVQQEKHIILLDLLPFIMLFYRIGGNKRRMGLFLLNHI